MNSSSHIDNKKKDILIFGKGPTQGLEHTMTAEKLYPVNFTKENTKFCLSFHYNGAHICLLMAQKLLNLKQKIMKLLHIHLGNISKDWLIDNVKKTRLKGYVYDFSVDYNAIVVSDILDIHKYLMEKNEIV